MKTLEKGQDKIQKISDQLRKEILEPAQQEAHRIIEEAKKKAVHIHQEAEKNAESLIQSARKANEQERSIFKSSLEQASKQAVGALRQVIEHHLFNEQLDLALKQVTVNPKVIADLITAIVKSIEKEGVSADLSAAIPKSVSAKEVNAYLVDGVLQRLKNESVVLEDFLGGAKVKYLDKNLTIDISETAIKDLLAQYVRKDFRKLIFGNIG